MAATKQHSRLTGELLDMADDMRPIGIMEADTHQQITARHLGREPLPMAAAITGEEIRTVGEQGSTGPLSQSHHRLYFAA